MKAPTHRAYRREVPAFSFENPENSIKPARFSKEVMERARASVLNKIPPFPVPPAGGFPLLYPDPPWHYSDRNSNGKRGAEHKYPVLKLPELIALRPEIDRMAAADCAMAMWVTGPQMPAGLRLLAAWGFQFKTMLFTWVKLTKGTKMPLTDMPKYHFGTGHWTRGNPEFCLLGTRGQPRGQAKNVPHLIVDPVREHSRKPEEGRARLVRIFGDVPRLEMFAQETTPGWTKWGLMPTRYDEKENPDAE